jgi:hypothetical protein
METRSLSLHDQYRHRPSDNRESGLPAGCDNDAVSLPQKLDIFENLRNQLSRLARQKHRIKTVVL